jgi:hypothetical protein
MNTFQAIVLSLMVTVIVVLGYVAIAHRPIGQPPEKIHAVQPKAVEITSASAVVSSADIPLSETAPSAPGNKTDQTPVAKKKIAATQASKPAKVKPPVQDPDARAALSLVGADPMAEQYWAAAINDPNLPANERKDLIEDLNEDGLSDPKHPGPQDLPLIANRLRLIEELAPSAMDAVNADAFAEAYKDLQNLAAGGTAQ